MTDTKGHDTAGLIAELRDPFTSPRPADWVNLCDRAASALSAKEEEIQRLRTLIQTLLDNDPTEPVADNGMLMFDAWKDLARRSLKGAAE